jgi:hypothetical protein
MLLNINTDLGDGSACLLTYDETEGWLRATWSGYVDENEAMRGAESYLSHAAAVPCAYLLNDNTALRGPWFDSLYWLARVWKPRAEQLGLRYVAHVVQVDRSFDILTEQLPVPLTFELQIFQDVGQAEHWLRQCQTTPVENTWAASRK